MKLTRTHIDPDRPTFQTTALPDPGHWATHILWDTGRYVIDGYIYDTDTLVVAFENAHGDFSETDQLRHGWGARLFRSTRVSHLAIKPKACDWYQGDCLSGALTELRESGFFDQFRQRITYGGSMGGFAAIAFADQVKATTVLAMCPQTTLNRTIVPWDTRFPLARKQSWTGPNSDAVGKSLGADRVLCVYDTHHEVDRLQVARLDQPNLHHICTPFLGHGIAAILVQLGAAKPMLAYAFGETDNLTPFHAALRKRRKQDRYFKIMSRPERVKSSPTFKKIVQRARIKAGFREEASKPAKGKNKPGKAPASAPATRLRDRIPKPLRPFLRQIWARLPRRS